MSALTVTTLDSLVEELFSAPARRPPMFAAPTPGAAPRSANGRAGLRVAVPSAIPTAIPAAIPAAIPTAIATASPSAAPTAALTAAPTAALARPPADVPVAASARVRLLPAQPRPLEQVAQGPVARVPPTLAQRVAVLRTTDRSPVVESADEERGPAPAADPAQVGRTIAHAVVEVLLGRRPVAQLARWVTPGVYQTIQSRAALTARGTGRRAPAAGRGATVRRVLVCMVEAHVCEVGAVVDDGTRVRAVALRLETHRGTWRTTALEVG
jgi:hypothetical protein